MIYLNNAATSWPKPPAVLAAMAENITTMGGNPGRSSYQMSVSAGRTVYKTRELIASLIGAKDPTRVVFTANATEALNLAILGSLSPGEHVITSSMEHNSVMRPLYHLSRQGVICTVLPTSAYEGLDPEDVRKAITPKTKMVIMTHASNVTGTILDIATVGRIVREHNLLFLVDAAQTAGVYPIDVEAMNIDLLAFPGHKGLLGPQGTGGLFIGERADVRPLKFGGTGGNSGLLTQPDVLPDRYESGTLNTVGLAGLAAGIEFINQTGMENIRKKEELLTSLAVKGLRDIPGVREYGPPPDKSRAAVISFTLGDGDPAETGYLLGLEFGIEVRTGLHCAPAAHKTIGTFPSGTVRVSPGFFNTEEEIAEFLRAVSRLAAETVI